LITIRNPQKRVTLGRLFNNTDDGYDIIFDSAVDITMYVPSALIERFTCGMFNEGAGIVTFIKVVGTQMNAPDGFKLPQGKVATMFKILAEDNQVLKGELTI
jgi:hypothetical protein